MPIQYISSFGANFTRKAARSSFFFFYSILKIPGPWSSLSGGGEPEQLSSGVLDVCSARKFTLCKNRLLFQIMGL